MVRVLEQDVEGRLRRGGCLPPMKESATRALDELAVVIATTQDEQLKARLSRIHRELGGTSTPSVVAVRLTPRERDALALVEIGAGNAEIADELGLSTETVKAYLRSAMRKLGVHNRTAAVHAARAAGAL
jgi:DNA-binding CsgD family transcriptional regulator